MSLVVGIDGGGTRVRAVVVDPEGVERGRAEAAGAVVSVRDLDAAVRGASEAVRAATAVAGASPPVSVLWAGLAGAGSAESSLAAQHALANAGLAETVVVGTDAEAAFHDAFGEGPGILLIAGTGSIAWGRGPSGEVVRVGGWGERVGDEGSGFAVGLEAIRAVLRARDGRGEETALTSRVLEGLEVTDPRALVGWASGATKREVAGLVPIVVEAAAAGDAVAEKILERAASELAAHLDAVLERTGPWTPEPGLVLSGGLLKDDGPLRGAMERATASRAVRLAPRAVDAAMGAAKLALLVLRRSAGRG